MKPRRLWGFTSCRTLSSHLILDWEVWQINIPKQTENLNDWQTAVEGSARCRVIHWVTQSPVSGMGGPRATSKKTDVIAAFCAHLQTGFVIPVMLSCLWHDTKDEIFIYSHVNCCSFYAPTEITISSNFSYLNSLTNCKSVVYISEQSCFSDYLKKFEICCLQLIQWSSY